MTGKALFKLPNGRRALQVARDQGLSVIGYTVHADGSIDVTVRDDADAKALTTPPVSEVEGEAVA